MEAISEEERRRIGEVIARHRARESDLISVLHEIQEICGYLPLEVQQMVAESFNIPLSEVHGVATFYALFSQEPRGKHTIKVCLGTACHVRGGEAILNTFERELGIKPGQTTPDRRFRLERVACVGCCALAPVVVVDEAVHGKCSPGEVKKILEGLG